MGQVPAIQEEDGFSLAESHAILRYLCQSRALSPHWYPPQARERAVVDFWLDWHHGNLRRGSMVLVFNLFLAPRRGLPVSQEKVKEATQILTTSLKFLNTHFEKTRHPFLTGPRPSIADISLSCEVAQLSLINFDLSPYVHVSAWLSRLSTELPYWEEVNAILKKVVAKSQEQEKGVKSKL
eukprot:GILI01031544.1.p2 GENE.GILI01031544.1~~GILI01031544.1.p2  ORF type:complete len:181 (-),score=54.88 GILI01031544.1:158-700(-)